MDRLTLIERFKENEDLAEKFHDVEVSILSILNFNDLFEVLLTRIREKFGIPLVWFSLVRETGFAQLLQAHAGRELLRENLSLVEGDEFARITAGSPASLLLNKDLDRYASLFPRPGSESIRSMAVTPVSVDGEVIGSLNVADFSPDRYRPGLDTIFLERLALKVSLCLSNVAAHENLRTLAERDPLTNLLNRRSMEKALNRELNRVERFGRTLSVAFVDVDDFKKVNDAHGHEVGDRLLQHLARTMVHLTRDYDMVTRYAGDEFVLILPETSPENAERLLSRIGEALEDSPLHAGDRVVPVTISYGIASRGGKEGAGKEDLARLLREADERLYLHKKGKKEGRDRKE
ncbi:sensor domain-containing diguanylate cyclase [Desulfuromonas sp.]|mgnify:CR=1 FL=1|uniref:sensor domain-containing diguanylate cyclase n=1 Tax=Desulfuromonas sp. TaxID=892 RepID=UPI0025C01A10|nr:sensor domain-containing diguanylate cyclase [Desulfuromonas sp.]